MLLCVIVLLCYVVLLCDIVLLLCYLLCQCGIRWLRANRRAGPANHCAAYTIHDFDVQEFSLIGFVMVYGVSGLRMACAVNIVIYYDDISICSCTIAGSLFHCFDVTPRASLLCPLPRPCLGST